MAQGALTRVWRGLPHFHRDGPGSFRAWVYAILKNLSSNIRRDRARRARREASSVAVELERQLAAAEAQSCEREVRRRRALAIMDSVWERLAKQYREAGEQALFDYLLDSVYTGNTQGDRQLSRALGEGGNYVYRRRHKLLKVDHRKALYSEYVERCLSQPAKDNRARPSFKDWARAIDDDLG
jgi:hypothetical protein